MKLQSYDRMISTPIDYTRIDALADLYFGDPNSISQISLPSAMTTQADLALDEESAEMGSYMVCGSKSCTAERPKCCG